MPKICAGITVYEPEKNRLYDNISAILPQVQRVFIIDNASKNQPVLNDELSKNAKIKYIKNENNLGIATALNQMCKEAVSEGFDFILTLDQDSVAETDLISKYIPYLDFDDVGMWTPNFFDDNEKSLTFGTEEKYSFVVRCNTSASLVKLSAYENVGGFDDLMFIDCVDFDFCTTLIENGYKILRVNDAVLHHRLGQAKEVKFFIPIGKFFGIKKLQKPFYTYNHSPLRTYYYARNIKYYAYKHRKFIDLRTEKRVYFQWLILKLGFEKQRFQKLKAIIKGKKDAEKMIKKYLKGR